MLVALEEQQTATPATAAERRRDACARARRCSPFLGQALDRFPAVEQLFLDEGAEAAVALAGEAGAEDVEADLRIRRHRLALAIALGDLAGELTLEQVTGQLSDFADEAIDRAIRQAFAERLPDEKFVGLAAIALGKLGSFELNYSSDVDLLLLFDPATLPKGRAADCGELAVRIARRAVEILQKRTADGYVARVDLRLRPSPEATPIILSVNAAISYYESAALGWERAAFIRARACAGDRALGERFLKAVDPFVWRRSLDFGAIDEIRSITRAVRDHYSERQAFGPGFDVKRGRGGIREVEFFAQAHQMIHGGRDPSLRQRATLDALGALTAAGHIDAATANGLADSYRLLRTVEHRLQMVADQQTHMLPRDARALDNVAALDGLDDGPALLELLRPSVERVAAEFDALAQEESEQLPSKPEALGKRLEAMGFEDVEQPVRRIAEWRSGRPRSLRSAAARDAFEAMLPELLKAIAKARDPAHALNRLSDIVDRMSSGINLYRLLQARPDLARLLARILGHAPALSDQLARRPQLLDGLLDSSSFDPPPDAGHFAAELKSAMQGLPYDLALDRARRLVNERRFALGVQLVDLREDPLEIGRGYSRVAEGAVIALAETAIDEFEQAHGRVAGAELLILGLGRLGGAMLTHASDLDLIFLHTDVEGSASDGRKPLGPSDYFNRLATRVSAALSVPTAAGPLYDVDTRLRPEGTHGMLAVSLDAFADYQMREAWTWEHMALTRARPLFGSPEGRAGASEVVDSILRRPRDPAKTVADAVRMREEIALHKPPAGPLDVKLQSGGLVDLEFAVHLLQLLRHQGLDPRLEEAVEQLAEHDLIEKKIVDAQTLLTRILVAIRLIAPDADVPPLETRALVAGACGAKDWDELLARHEEARQSVSRLWTRMKEFQG